MRTIAWAMPARVWLLALAVQTPARGQEAAISAHPLEEIIVTAQKWEQAANTVGMSITAATSDMLLQHGITSVAGLTRLVPGLTIQERQLQLRVFHAAGRRLFQQLATPPAVTVYLDEAPFPYPAMTKLIAFDVARVEVLNSPQGTLYGQNATGGAVNYIAAKPTKVFDTGMDATYGRWADQRGMG